MVPVIETERLVLRGHRADDLDARAAMGAEPAVTRFFGGVPQTREDTWHRLQRYAGHWALLGHGLFAVEERGVGLVGEVGLGRFERGLGGDFDPAPEAGWIFAGAAHGRGLAGEAMRAALAWHEERFGPERQVCLVAPENTPSLRLADRLGFRPYREAAYHGRPAVLLERLPLAAGARSR